MKEILLVYPELNEKYTGKVVETENQIVVYIKEQRTANKRICAKCKKFIKRNHKYYSNNGKKMHKDCKNPDTY